MTRPWPAGAATGIGSLPGTDPAEAARLVFGELPDLPHLPELPARGAGADMIGRAAALLVDLPVEIVPSGWRLAARPGRDLRRARDYLAWDLDALEEQSAGYEGALKVQVAGPWTLAANLELPSGHRAVSDRGATREIAESLAEGLRGHLRELARRVPAARPVVQLDEPELPAVLAGHVPTPSGYGTVGAIESSVVEAGLRSVLDVVPQGGRVVHCCARNGGPPGSEGGGPPGSEGVAAGGVAAGGVPIELIRGAGADAIALDAALLDRTQNDTLGEAIDAGTSLWLGVLPSRDAEVTLDGAREPIRRLWRTLGFSPALLPDRVVPTPTCGLAGATPDYARRVFALLRDVGAWLADAD